MEKSRKKNFGFGQVRKYFPFIFLIFLTISLMLFFKHNKRDISKMIEEGKNNLLSFYAENLKPLLYQTKISDEDIFNFALYNTLPLDKDRNKILEISGGQSGSDTFVIKSTRYNPNTKNYETFVKYMGMNDVQKEEADSILNSYKKEIYSSILVNEKNTYAVNPKLGELQQAVLADLVTFAQKINQAKSKDLFAENFNYHDKNEFANIISSAKKISQNEYLLITPDTVARSYFKWDQEKFNKHLSAIEKDKLEISPSVPNLEIEYEGSHATLSGRNIVPPTAISFNTDSNFFKVVVPVESMELAKSINEKVRVKLNEAASKMKKISLHFELGRFDSKNSGRPRIPESPETIINPYEIVNKTMEMLAKTGGQDWEKFGAQMDSLSKLFNPYMKDSLKKKIQEDMLRATKDFKKKKSKVKVDTLK